MPSPPSTDFLRPRVGSARAVSRRSACLSSASSAPGLSTSAMSPANGRAACGSPRPTAGCSGSSSTWVWRTDWALPLVGGVVGPGGSWTLALDRTHWKIGSREVNFLVLAVVTRRFRVPLLWSGVAGQGQQRDGGAHRPDEALPRRAFPPDLGCCSRTVSSSAPTGSNSSTTTISPSPSACGRTCASSPRTAASSPSSPACMRRGKPAPSAPGSGDDAGPRPPPELRRQAPRRRVAHHRLQPAGPTALAAYRKRWAIECLFGDAKTRGLNLEDTRLTSPASLPC